MSPIHAIDSGISAPAAAPESNRAATSAFNVGANAHAKEVNAHASVAILIVRYFPKRSPIGPYASCSTPYATAKAVTVCAAAESPTPYSTVSRGNSGSQTRRAAEEPQAPNDSATIDRVGPAPGRTWLADDDSLLIRKMNIREARNS